MIIDHTPTAFDNLTSFQLAEWLYDGNPTRDEAEAIEAELVTRQQRLDAIADLLF